MRVVAEYYTGTPPLVRLFIQGAPHRRMHPAVIRELRHQVWWELWQKGVSLPIAHPVDLEVTFLDPTSPDLDNLLMALYRALDGSRLKERDRLVLMDDGLVQKVTMSKVYVNRRSER
jgi:Holliday junction resolvase RusA-like endonuclease